MRWAAFSYTTIMIVTLEAVKRSLGLPVELSHYDDTLTSLIEVAKEQVAVDVGEETLPTDLPALLYQLLLVTVADLFLQRTSVTEKEVRYNQARESLIDTYLRKKSVAAWKSQS